MKKLFICLVSILMAFGLILPISAEEKTTSDYQNITDQGIIKAVKDTIKDPIIADYILKELDEKMAEQSNWEVAIKEITEINLPYEESMGRKIQDLSGIQWENLNIQSINFSGHDIQDIAVLSTMTGLKNVNLSGNKIQETGPLEKLTNLETLDLSKNLIEDLGGIDDLTNLKSLNISANKIEDLGALEKMTSLSDLDISDNDIEDLGTLAKLTSLEKLNIENNLIEDLSPLFGLENLTTLSLSGNYIRDFSQLEKLEGVTVAGADAQNPEEKPTKPTPEPETKPETPSTPVCAGSKDKNCDGVVTCEEEKGEGWTWNNTTKVCEYTGKTSYTVVNTAAK